MRQDVKKLIQKLQDWPDGILHTNPDGTEVISIYIEDYNLYPRHSGTIQSYIYHGEETENAVRDMKKAAQNIFAVHGKGPFAQDNNPYRLMKIYEQQFELCYQDIIQTDNARIPAKILIEPSQDDSTLVYCSYYEQGYPHNYQDQVHMTVEHDEAIFYATKIDTAKVSPQVNAKENNTLASWQLYIDALVNLDLKPKKTSTKVVSGKEPVPN